MIDLYYPLVHMLIESKQKMLELNHSYIDVYFHNPNVDSIKIIYRVLERKHRNTKNDYQSMRKLTTIGTY